MPWARAEIVTRTNATHSNGFTYNLGQNQSWEMWVSSAPTFTAYNGTWSTTKDTLNPTVSWSWNGSNYGILPRVGIGDSPSWSTKVDSVAENLSMSFNYTRSIATPSNSDSAVWSGVYGWLDDTPQGWADDTGSTSFAVKTEFYVVEDFYKFPPNTQLGNVLQGFRTIDGRQYAIYRDTTARGADQWISVRTQGVNAIPGLTQGTQTAESGSGSVNIEAHFDAWRDLGMRDDYVIELNWASEILGQSDGTFTYNSYTLPASLTAVPEPSAIVLVVAAFAACFRKFRFAF
jgi:hypothetical protein